VNREEKTANIAELRDRFARASVTIVAESKGLTVAKTRELRRAIRAAGGEFKIAKNTLARLALQETAFKKLGDLLRGPTGIVFGYADPVSVTKALVKFAETNDKVSVKGAVLDAKALSPAEVAALAKLPSREALLGMLLGTIQAPATQLLRTMNEPGASLARLLGRVRERLEQNLEPPTT